MKCFQCDIKFTSNQEYTNHMEKYHGYAGDIK